MCLFPGLCFCTICTVWGSYLELTPSEGAEYWGDGKARLGNAFNELVDDNYRVPWLGLDVHQAWTRAMTTTLHEFFILYAGNA